MSDMDTRERQEILFGKRIQKERARLGWTQVQLAERMTAKGVQITASQIAKVEKDTGPRVVRLAEARAMAELFEVSLDNLMGRAPTRNFQQSINGLISTLGQAINLAESEESLLRDRIADLAAHPLRPGSVAAGLVARCELACDALAVAREALEAAIDPPGLKYPDMQLVQERLSK
jgi:transcriptional regulator with XRE-family HTH domain